MKVAIIGSRNLGVIGLENFLPENVTEIVSGGARGVDTCAREYVQAHNIPLTEFLPDYTRYGSIPYKIKYGKTVNYTMIRRNTAKKIVY